MIYNQALMITFRASDAPPRLGKLQVAAGTAYLFLLQIMIYGGLGLLVYGIVTINVWIIAGFIVFQIVQLNLGKWESYVSFVNKVLQPHRYFRQFQIIHQEVIPDDEKTTFGAHPHSVLALGMLGALHVDPKNKLSNVTHLVSRAMLNTPIAGGLLRIWGVQSVDAANMKRLMKQGKSISLIPGGFEEATITSTRQMRIWIENRKGFIKYSLQNGYTIRPVLIMGEHQAYSIFEPFLKLRLFINRFKVPALIFWNWRTGLFLPWDFGMSIVVGRGIKGGQREQITQDMIDTAHTSYKEEILRLYDKHRHLNGDKPIRLL